MFNGAKFNSILAKIKTNQSLILDEELLVQVRCEKSSWHRARLRAAMEFSIDKLSVETPEREWRAACENHGFLYRRDVLVDIAAETKIFNLKYERPNG